MKRKFSNPFRLLFAGVLDTTFCLTGFAIFYESFDKEIYTTPIRGSFHSLSELLAGLFVVFYVFILLPLLEYKGGSLGKRIFGLRNIRKDKKLRSIPFNNFFRKSLFVGVPILLLFLIRTSEFYVSNAKSIWPLHLAIDVIVIGVFVLQILSIFIAKISLFEFIAATIVVDKKQNIEDLFFSFEMNEKQDNETYIDKTKALN